jgi:hypothetical protein
VVHQLRHLAFALAELLDHHADKSLGAVDYQVLQRLL